MRPLGENDPLSISSYRLLGVLGGGGMGRVYLGESRSGRRVAIKMVHADLAQDIGFRRRFAREVAAVRAVNPLFTAAVVDADTEAAEPWLATTYIDGPSLATRVGQSGPLPAAAVLVLASGLAEGLAAIHRAGLVHRDLKPSNVIINDDGPHIIDFGIALATQTATTSSLLLGTPSYIAPERIHGSEADPASDIFSLGATLVFAATGKPLVAEGPVYAQLMQITTGRFDFDQVPIGLRPLIVRCVSHEPKDRPTAEELSRILGAAGIPPPTPGWYASTAPATVVDLPAYPGGRLTRRRLLVLGGLLGTAAAGAGVAAVAWPSAPIRRVTRLAGLQPSPTPPAPVVPGAIVWQARSGAQPLAPSPGNLSEGMRILIDGGRHLIAANGPNVFAVDRDGSGIWQMTMPTGLVTLRRWGDAVLVNDGRQLWLLDPVNGHLIAEAAVAEDEERAAAGDNPDGLAVEIGDIALAPDRAYLSLGTATVALDRKANQVWRTPRPPRLGNGTRPPSGGPAAADARILIIHNVTDDLIQIGLRDAANGDLQWVVEYPARPPAVPQAPGPGPGPRPGGPAGPGGPPPTEEDWLRSEARLVGPYVVLRERRDVHVLDTSDGNTAWQRVSATPVASLEVVDQLVLISADRLTAYGLATGGERWQVDLRGARIAISPDQRTIVAANDDGVTGLDVAGRTLWHTAPPSGLADTAVDRVSVSQHLAYVTVKARGQRRDPLPVDVLAVALDTQAA